MQKRMHSYSGKKLIYGEIWAGLLRFDSSISFALPVTLTIASKYIFITTTHRLHKGWGIYIKIGTKTVKCFCAD